MLLAAADADDRYHQRATEFLTDHQPDQLMVPVTVVAETAWMIKDRLDPATEAASVRHQTLAVVVRHNRRSERCR